MILSGLWKRLMKSKEYGKITPIKYCCNCKYYRLNTSDPEDAKCTHEAALINTHKLVICENMPREYLRCSSMRNMTVRCGLLGKLYEEA